MTGTHLTLPSLIPSTTNNHAQYNIGQGPDFVKFRDRISLFTKKPHLTQYADGSIYDYPMTIHQSHSGC